MIVVHWAIIIHNIVASSFQYLRSVVVNEQEKQCKMEAILQFSFKWYFFVGGIVSLCFSVYLLTWSFKSKCLQCVCNHCLVWNRNISTKFFFFFSLMRKASVLLWLLHLFESSDRLSSILLLYLNAFPLASQLYYFLG